MTTAIAIDWSGAAERAEKKIWLAESRDGLLRRVENGRDRTAITQHLVELARGDSELIVGLDFAFSLPAWFLRARGIPSAHELWARMAAGECEEWLREPLSPPFFGRRGARRPRGVELFRRDEQATGAKSVFQVGGAGAVGTGSLRGMPVLHALHAAGFSIWPFDPPARPLVVEIYPCACYNAPLTKSCRDSRAAYVAAHCAHLPPELARPAIESDDAFDATVAAIAMDRHLPDFAALSPCDDPLMRLEGTIWRPCGSAHR